MQVEGVRNVVVGAGIRQWAEQTSSAALFGGQDLADTDLFDWSLDAQREALAVLLELGIKWDTVIGSRLKTFMAKAAECD